LLLLLRIECQKKLKSVNVRTLTVKALWEKKEKGTSLLCREGQTDGEKAFICNKMNFFLTKQKSIKNGSWE
jgi:hypothetical protein